MSQTGLDTQFGFIDEVTYGTFLAPTRFLEIRDEAIKMNIERINSSTLRSGKRLLQRWEANRKGANGPVTFEVHNKGYSKLFKHCLGGTPVVTTPSGGTISRQHVIPLGNLDGKSMTIQKGLRPVTSGAASLPFSYVGCKVAQWELSMDVDGLLILKVTFDAQDEDLGQALATPSYASGLKPLSFQNAQLAIAGGNVDVSRFSVAGNNGIKTDRYFMRSATGTGKKKEQLEQTTMREYTGTLDSEFEDLTAYNRFVNGTTASLKATFNGDIIEGAIKFSLVVDLAKVRFDGETPNADSMDVIRQNLPFTVVDEGAGDTSVQFTYVTTDTTE